MLFFQVPGFYARLTPGGDPNLFQISIQLTENAKSNLSIRIQNPVAKVGGKRMQVKFQILGETPLMVPKGGQALEFSAQLLTDVNDAVIELPISMTAGRKSVQRVVYRYLPPRGKALEEQLASLRRLYVGKQVWVYGGDLHDEALDRDHIRFVGDRQVQVASVLHNGTEFVMNFAPVNAPVGVRDEQRGIWPTPDKTPTRSRYFYLTALSKTSLFESVSLKPPVISKGSLKEGMERFRYDWVKNQRDALWILGKPSLDKPWESVFRQDRWMYSIV
ncbi:MAG: hypothetical protein ACAH95_14295, partial [Fimbriimonas sp.]